MEKNIEIEKLIPSKAVREQCIKENRVFSLKEQATLIWNNPELINCEKIDLLKTIAAKVKGDSRWPELYRQIMDRIEQDLFMERKFFSDEEKQFYYILIPRKRNSTLIQVDRIHIITSIIYSKNKHYSAYQ